MPRERYMLRTCLLIVLAFAGCHLPVAWRGPVLTTAAAPVAASPAGAAPAAAPAGTKLSPPQSLRPCCAFGTGLKVAVDTLPVPWFQVDNVVEAGALGTHTYDNGLGVNDRTGSEHNGLVYTCRGGFIDLAHVRDYADWTVYLAWEIDRHAASGGVIVLPPEGGERFLVIQPLPASRLTRANRRATVIDLARYAAFNLSVWHELASGSGWASFQMFPETASTFSPEDLYSNVLGTRIAADILLDNQADGEAAFNAAMTERLPAALAQLGAIAKEGTDAVLTGIDGQWWDSSQRLPSERLVLVRNYAFAPPLRPWLVPWTIVQRWCPRGGAPTRLPLPTRFGGEPMDRFLQLFVSTDETITIELPHPESRWLSQRDFPVLVDRVRRLLAEKGLRDHP